ncbi:MAG: RDD family protein [Pseudomonadota bacterium]
MDTHLEVSSATGTEVIEEIAGAGSRSYAYVLDWHVRVLLVVLWYLGCMIVLRTSDLYGFASDSVSVILWMNLPPGLIYLLYHPVLELLMGGNTPGKNWAGVQIVDEHGNAPSSSAILIRNVFRIVDSLPAMYTVGLITVLMTKRQVRFGDMMAGTLMVMRARKTDEALAKIEKIAGARVDPQTAEIVVELLERRATMKTSQWLSLSQKVLERAGVKAEKDTEKSVRAALQSLLSPND